MKHLLLLITIIAFTYFQLYGTSVDEDKAKKVAISFISSISGTSQLKSGYNLQLVYKAGAQNSFKNIAFNNGKQATCFYVFSDSETKGFVIVSGDDRAFPILGYSCTNSFDSENIPPNMLTWLAGYEKQIQYAVDNNLKPSSEISKKWLNFLHGTLKNTTVVVEPLIETQWGQEPFYNDLCPYHNSLNAKTVTGCTATAMAQIMKYWTYPVKGTGSHSYTPKSYPELGVISADYKNTEYNWDAMPNTISEPNSEIAKLMFHCGVSIDMDYGINNSWGTFVFYNHPSTLLAFRDYFGYKHTNERIEKSDYQTTAEWINTIKEELINKRPVLYSGGIDKEKNIRGHSFICDGLDSNNFFHLNWGWGGIADGYFSTDALIIMDVIDLSINQDAIINIEPLTVNPTEDIRLNSKVIVSPSVYLTPGQSFSVSTGFKNSGAVKYEGLVLAVLWDNNYQFAGIVDNEKNISLESGTNSEVITFSTSGLESLIPGVYYLTFYCTTEGNSTKLIGNSTTRTGVYQFIKILVSDSNTILNDEFENNNSEITAYELTPTFNENIASLKIDANIHNTSDLDFYKIKFPAGFNYDITSLLTDNWSYNYFSDVKYSYKSENSSWSTPEDACIPDFTLSGDDDYLYFKIEPFTTGYMGEYELSFDITREEKEITKVQEFSKSFLTIYPNPSNGKFKLKLGSEYTGENEITIYNLTGKIISKTIIQNHAEISEQIVLDVPPGTYLLQIRNKDKCNSKKIIVMK